MELLLKLMGSVFVKKSLNYGLIVASMSVY